MTDPVPTRRSMLTYATGGVLAVGAVGLARPLLGNWAPAADTVSGRDSLFDISGMAPDEERSLLVGWIPDHARRYPSDGPKGLMAWRVVKDFDVAPEHPGLSPDGRHIVLVNQCVRDGLPLIRVETQGDGLSFKRYCRNCGAHYSPDGVPAREWRRLRGPLVVPELVWDGDRVVARNPFARGLAHKRWAAAVIADAT